MATTKSPPKPSSLRLLVLSPTPSDSKSIPPFIPFLETITGSKPLSDITTFAGYTSHPPLKLRTKYYLSDVSIWCDELPPLASEHYGTAAQSRNVRKEVDTSGDGEADHGDGSLHGPKAEKTEPQEETSSPPPPSLSEWISQILSSEAAEVRAVIGGIILLLPISSTSAQPISQSSSTPPNPDIHLIQALHELREAIEDESPGRDIASLVVLQSTSPTITKKNLADQLEKLEDLSLSEGCLGWDLVAWDGQVRSTTGDGASEVEPGITHAPTEDNLEDERNEFGEKTGIKRVLEVLEGIDWTASPSFDLDDADSAGLDLDDLNLGDDEDLGARKILSGDMGMNMSSGLDFELQREMMELKMSMLEGEDDDDENDQDPVGGKEDDEEGQIDELPALLERVVAIREAGAEMGKEEREKFAKREIARIMREMG
ncbi:hypothetical protein H2200_003518 [Cladophialophora chaetospira]|uniref:Alpha and gamma adaptin binding protein p34 n=1 Tax=Cladophialophora chaetospira TaxID=386627 RepID=A0AA38XI75_9EURO|nr:hypothetical protein H2200_003518 [Cladophialophora chaetospira]